MVEKGRYENRREKAWKDLEPAYTNKTTSKIMNCATQTFFFSLTFYMSQRRKQ
jgi:hypothetical protein